MSNPRPLADRIVLGDAATLYASWPTPALIFVDGPRGEDRGEHDLTHDDLPLFYEKHVKLWTHHSNSATRLLLNTSFDAWPTTHTLLHQAGWSRRALYVWDKGQHTLSLKGGELSLSFELFAEDGHEIFALYDAPLVVRPSGREKMRLQAWLRSEWLRTELPLKDANRAVATHAAQRVWLTSGPAWSPPIPTSFGQLSEYANKWGKAEGKPFFSLDGASPLTEEQYAALFPIKGKTWLDRAWPLMSTWNREPLRSPERCMDGTHPVHPYQTPHDLLHVFLSRASAKGQVVWEPFGGLFSFSLLAEALGRVPYGSELSEAYLRAGLRRFQSPVQLPLTEGYAFR